MSRYTRVPRATAISTSPDTERTDVEPAATDPISTSPETVARRTEPATVPSETSPEALLPPTSRPTSRTRASPDAEWNESPPPTAAPTRSPLATVTLTSPSTSSKRQLPDPLRNDSEPIRPLHLQVGRTRVARDDGADRHRQVHAHLGASPAEQLAALPVLDRQTMPALIGIVERDPDGLGVPLSGDGDVRLRRLLGSDPDGAGGDVELQLQVARCLERLFHGDPFLPRGVRASSGRAP